MGSYCQQSRKGGRRSFWQEKPSQSGPEHPLKVRCWRFVRFSIDGNEFKV